MSVETILSGKSPISSIDTIELGGSQYTVKTADVLATSSGNTQLIAAPGANLAIRILTWHIWGDTAMTVLIQDAAGTPVVIERGYPAANGGGVDGKEKLHRIATTNTAINLNLSINGNVFCQVTYIEETV